MSPFSWTSTDSIGKKCEKMSKDLGERILIEINILFKINEIVNKWWINLNKDRIHVFYFIYLAVANYDRFAMDFVSFH